MLRRFYRIGFGGCGCAMVVHFIEHVNVIYRGILLNDYRELAKWENGLANESRLRMGDKLKELRERIFAQERETSYSLEEVEKYIKLDEYLDAWDYSLGELLANTPWMSYEEPIVREIKDINRTMDRKAEAIKAKEEAVLLEGLMVDSFSGTSSATGGADKARFLYNKMIKKTRPLIVNKYDADILDSEGFDHHPELQMLPFSMKEVRYEVYEVISKAAEKGTEIGSRGNFFFVGLGGGTGTGVISPLAEQFGKGSRGYFTLGLLGGKDDNKYLGSQQPWFRRCFNILLALNDLIATADLDGIILVDNEVLMARLEARGKLEEQGAVSSDRNDFNKFLEEEFGMDWVKHAEIVRSKFESAENKIIHIYDAENFVEINIDNTRQSATLKISDGRIYNLKVEEWFLFSWDNVPQKVDGILLSFLRGDFNIEWAENAEISKVDGNTIRISNGGDSAEITIGDDGKKATIKVSGGKTYDLKVKNEDGKQKIYAGKIHGRAYAEKIDEELTKIIYPAFGITACEESGSDIDWAQLKHHMKLEEQEQRSPIFVPCYASGDVNANTKDLINDALDSGMLAKCVYCNKEEDKIIADKIICYVRDIRDEDGIKAILSDKFKTNTEEIKIIKRAAKRKDVLNDVSAKIIVFESKTSKEEGERKENEVLLLLRNCDVKDTLYPRLKEAQSFVDLLVAFKELIEEKRESPGSTEEIAKNVIKNLIKGENGKVKNILKDISKDGIEAEYLFSWDRVQDDNKEAKNKLMWSLRNVFNIDWAKDLKIEPTHDEIICKPKEGDKSKITIKKEAGGTATLKIDDGKTYNLKIINDNGEQKVYESENRASEKILQEAKSFLLPMDIGPQKLEATYKDMIEIVANLKAVVTDAINNLDAGIRPIFTDPIFKIKSAVASDAEVNLTSMLAMSEDTYSTYRDALGGDKVDQLFNEFQRETLEDRAYVDNSGGAGDHILTDRGENVLGKGYLFSWNNVTGDDKGRLVRFLRSDFAIDWAKNAEISKLNDDKTIRISEGKNSAEIRIDDNNEKATLKISDGKDLDLKVKNEGGKLNIYGKSLNEELDEVSKAIEKPSDLLEWIDRKKFLRFVKDAEEEISFPKLLVLSLLYSKWEYLCGWDNICGVDGNENGKLIKELSQDPNFDWIANDAVIQSFKSDTNTFSISYNGHLAEITICDKENGKFKEIRAGRHWPSEDIGNANISRNDILGKLKEVPPTVLFSWDDIPEKVSDSLLSFLKGRLGIDWAENANISKDDSKTIRIFNDENSAKILIDENNEKAILKFSNGKTHDLKVKKEDGKLNICAFALPTELNVKEEGDNKWRIIDEEKGKDMEYYVRIENGSLKIFEDKILGLKVKDAEAGTLKIYKRR